MRLPPGARPPNAQRVGFQPLLTPQQEQQMMLQQQQQMKGRSNNLCCGFSLAQWCCCGCFSLVSLLLIVVLIFRILTYRPWDPAHNPFPPETCVDVQYGCNIQKALGRCPNSGCTRTCTGCVPFGEAETMIKTIRNDQVDLEVAYAPTGSDIPVSLHGIWWMDQSGNSSIAKSPDYDFNFNSACETLVTFGDDAQWMPGAGPGAHGCVAPVYFFGGTSGHWTVQPTPCGENVIDINTGQRMALSFCFTDETQQEIEIFIRVFADGLGRAVLRALGFIDVGQNYVMMPPGLLSFLMVKNTWGWDRQSRIGLQRLRDISDETWDRMERVLPKSIWSVFELARTGLNTTMYYPVLQVVDGDGARTKWFPEYLEQADAESNGTGTQLMPVRIPAGTP